MSDYKLRFTGEFETEEGKLEAIDELVSEVFEQFQNHYDIHRKPSIKIDKDSDTDFRESFVDGVKGIYWGPEEFEFKTNLNRNWEKALRHQLTYFLSIACFEKSKEVKKTWHQIIAWSSAFMMAEEVIGEKPYYVDKVDKNKIVSNKDRIKLSLDKRADFNRSKLFYGGAGFDVWTGFSIAYELGKELRALYCIDEFHAIERDTFDEALDDIGDQS